MVALTGVLNMVADRVTGSRDAKGYRQDRSRRRDGSTARGQEQLQVSLSRERVNAKGLAKKPRQRAEQHEAMMDRHTLQSTCNQRTSVES